MKIAILSRNTRLYSTQRLVDVARERGHVVRVLDPLRCYVRIAPGNMSIRYKGKAIKGIDAVIPRIGVTSTFYGTAVLRQLEMMGLDTPATVFGDNPDDTADVLAMLGEPPHVIKLNEGSQGTGVVLAEKRSASQSVIEAFRGLYANFLVQEFIAEAKGSDLRCFVVGKKVVAAMQRDAVPGEFRANIHRGATAKAAVLTAEEKRIAVKAAAALGLEIAGVDLLRSNRGALILEVNASPGLEGIEAATGVNVSQHIIQLLEQHAQTKRPVAKAVNSSVSAN